MMLWLGDDLTSRKMVVQRAMLFSAVTVLVLFLFQPFGTNNDTISYKFLRLSGYGLVTFCGLLLAGTLEIWLVRRKLNRKLRLLIIPSIYLGIVAIFNHSYFVVAMLGMWHWQNQLLFILYTLAIGLFPIAIIYVVNRDACTTTPLQQTVAPNVSYETLDKEPVKSQLITLTGDNKSDNFQVDLSQILFIKSADNYCELAIFDGDNASNKLLRSSLANILNQLPDNSLVRRCHRSFAVNLGLVELSPGNAGGLQLLMKPTGVTVPVSRSYVDTIKPALLLVPKAC